MIQGRFVGSGDPGSNLGGGEGFFPVNGATTLHIGLNLTKAGIIANRQNLTAESGWHVECGILGWRDLETSAGVTENQMHINFSRGLSRFIQYCIPVVGKSRG